MGNCVQDLGEHEAGEVNDISKAHTLPSLPCDQFQAQRNEDSDIKSIVFCKTITSPNVKYSLNLKPTEYFTEAVHSRTTTSSQSKIFSGTSTSSSSMTGTLTFRRNYSHPPSVTKVTSSASSSNDCRTTTHSQSEIFSYYEPSSEAS